MKIDYCITEMGFEGKMPRNNPNMRVLEAQMLAWDAEHIPIVKVLNENKTYEGNVVVVLPKGGVDKQIIRWLVEKHFNTFENIKSKFTGKIWFYQDGETGYWNQHTATLQIWWYNNVSQCDKILCPNETDISFYKGMFPNKSVAVMRSIMSYDEVKENPKEAKTIISGPLTREYNGLQQIMIAKRFEVPIYIPPMGQERMPKDSWTSAKSLDVNYLDYTDWITWMKNLSSYKYAVNLPGVTAAASFSLNCAWWGIPCIGDVHADTQRICFPELSIKYNDIETAIKLADILKEDKQYYEHISNRAKETVRKEFTKEKFLKIVSE